MTLSPILLAHPKKSGRVQIRQFILSILLGLTLWIPEALAGPPLFGAEFTFSSDALQTAAQGQGRVVNIAEVVAAQVAMRNILQARCAARGDCSIQILQNGYGVETYRVNYTDGFWFQISTDPSVVEVQTNPNSAENIERLQNRIQTDIFDVAADPAVGIRPFEFAGGGHIHMGLESTFGGDARLFRNFMVDFVNHWELASGILSTDHLNAPPIAALKDSQRKEFINAIRDFDEGKIKTIEKLAARVEKRVLRETPSGWAPAIKYHAMVLTRIISSKFKPSERTIELRSIRAQRSAKEYALITKLFDRRVAFLRSHNAFLELEPFNDLARTMKNHEKVAAARFRTYVEDSGLQWSDYQGIARAIPSEVMAAAPDSTSDRSSRWKIKLIKNKNNRTNTCVVREFSEAVNLFP